MSTKGWSDDKRRHNLLVADLWMKKYQCSRQHSALVREYFNAEAIADLAERRRVRADLNDKLKAALRELERAKAKYYAANRRLLEMS